MAVIDCFKCKYFYITLDERFPRGCSVFSIKGKNLPSVDVKRATGYECPTFTPKKREEDKKVIKEDRKLDFLA